MDGVSRSTIRAVLAARDHRHGETHAVICAMWQALVAELIEQGALQPGPLAERLRLTRQEVGPTPHGDDASDMLEHVLGWLERAAEGPPMPHPVHWNKRVAE